MSCLLSSTVALSYMEPHQPPPGAGLSPLACLAFAEATAKVRIFDTIS